MVLKPIPCSVYRGGTSKGLYFHARDLPSNQIARDQLLLAAMGSPDARQIDGMGGAHPLTSKVAIVSPSSREDADVDYLFLQVMVDQAEVSDAQNCGNILAGVGPFAIESGLVCTNADVSDVRIHMLNTGALAVARVETPGGQVNYEGAAHIDGVPGTAAPIALDFKNIAGSSCGALLPTGQPVDHVNGVEVTCIDNGMPVVVLDAADFGLSGAEEPATLEANEDLKTQLESIRLELGPKMNLGNVSDKTVPKMCLVSPATNGGVLGTRTFIPHRVHDAIGVLGSVSVATACMLPESIAQRVSGFKVNDGVHQLQVEHPTGFFTVEMEVLGSENAEKLEIQRAALLRTARLLMRGELFVPERGLSHMNVVSLLGFGEVGARLCADLLKTCAADVCVYDTQFANPKSKPSQHYRQLNEPRVIKASSAEHAAQMGELIVSAVTADQALPAAQSVCSELQTGAWFVDLNSVSPGEKIAVGNQITKAGGRFIEAAVMSPIGRKGIATAILLAGPLAQAFVDVGRQLGFTGMRVLSDQAGQAAASKMCRSIIVKGTEALLTEALLTARHFGVEQTVLDSLSDLFPNTDWNQQAHYMISRSVLHGARRAEEMAEVAKTVIQANAQPLMSEACVARQQWAGAQSVTLGELDLLDMLDVLGSTSNHRTDAGT